MIQGPNLRLGKRFERREMMVKSRKAMLSALIVVGIVLSILNFSTQVQATGIQGTTTTMHNPQQLAYYYQTYGEEYMYHHWLGYDLVYCLDNPSNCSVPEY
jgi:hypothetical protein